MIRSITPVPGCSPFAVRAIGGKRRLFSVPAGSYAQAIDLAKVSGQESMILAKMANGQDALVGVWSPDGGEVVVDAKLVGVGS
jgi:hypothetical protein